MLKPPTGRFRRVVRNVVAVLRIKKYFVIAFSTWLALATIVPLLTLAVTGVWIYRVTSRTIATLVETQFSYILAGVFLSLLAYSRRRNISCRGGVCTGVVGTALSSIGCCSPIIYILFVTGLLSSSLIPFLTLIPLASIIMLGSAIWLLASRVDQTLHLNTRVGGSSGETCCDVLGRHLDPSKNWYTARKASGEQWIPAFVKYVDTEKCIGCGLCLKVCMGGCYKLRKVEPRELTVSINGVLKTVKVTKQAVVVNPGNCLGDCHCHKICPVDGGAMICEPLILET